MQKLVAGCVSLLWLVSSCAGGADAPMQGSAAGSPAAPSASAAAFDPLAFTEPDPPPEPKGKPTAGQMLRALASVAKAYSYSLRSGFAINDWRAGCDCSFSQQTAELAAKGLHAEMSPVRMRILAKTPVRQLDDNVWGIQVRAEFSIPAAVIADADGSKVREEPAQTRVADIALNVSPGELGWFIMNWQFES